MPDSPEMVNHPRHYNSSPSGVECIDVVEHYDFLIGNIIKYAWRAGLKDGSSKLEDLKKCAWYAQRACEKEECAWYAQRACEREEKREKSN